MAFQSGWSDADVAEVKRLYDAGLSSAGIASELSVTFGRKITRNAVIGILHRKQIGGRVKPKPTPYKPRKPSTRKINVVRPTAHGSMIVIETSERTDKLELADVSVDPLNIPFADLKHGDCRYPYGDADFRFCGHAALPGFSYCGPHQRLTHGQARITAEEVAISNRLFRRKLVAEAA